MSVPESIVIFTMCEIAKNDGIAGRPLWLIYKDGVYDVTKFAKSHPGGVELITEYAGKDATSAFNYVGHSTEAIKALRNMKIGIISSDCLSKVQVQTDENTKRKKRRFKFFHFFCE